MRRRRTIAPIVALVMIYLAVCGCGGSHAGAGR